jgi:hypothetical protein
VELSYTKVDDYNNLISTTLSSADAPDIYFAYDFMMGSDNHKAVFEHAEDLSDPALNIDLSSVRPSLLCKDESGACPMAPIFASTSGILVNEDLFEKEGISVPTNYEELLAACDAFNKAGYPTAILTYNTPSTYGNVISDLMYGDAAKDPEMVEKLNALDPSAGEYMKPVLEKVNGLVAQNMGEKFMPFAPYIAAILGLSAASSLSSLLGLYAPDQSRFTADYAIPFLRLDCSAFSPLVYLRNLELIPFADLNLFRYREGLKTGSVEAPDQDVLWCAGADLNLKLGNFFWLPYETTLGIRVAWNNGKDLTFLKAAGVTHVDDVYVGLMFSTNF